MSALNIALRRLYSQLIAPGRFERPDRTVSWFGAMQAQDYASVKWAIGLRCRKATEPAIEQAFANRTIVRTWLMRGTLHVVAASDVRWMLALLAPRIISSSARRYRQLELDETTLAHSLEVLTHVLHGGKQLTRSEIFRLLSEAGISTTGQRGPHILRRAALDSLICFGPIQGKQETWVLLDEWVPRGKSLGRSEALAQLAECYVRGHGPATLQDFVWWSGLLTADARAGLDTARARLCQETIDGQSYWLPRNSPIDKIPSTTAYLLPAFDEYFLGYRERSAMLNPRFDRKAVSNSGVFRPIAVIDGQIVGTWRQALSKGLVTITLDRFRSTTSAEDQALLMAADQYGAFLGLSVVLAG